MGALALADASDRSLDEVVLEALAPRRGTAPICLVCGCPMHRTSNAGEPLTLRCSGCLSVLGDGDAPAGQPVQLRLVT
jgi:hypothetical protein